MFLQMRLSIEAESAELQIRATGSSSRRCRFQNAYESCSPVLLPHTTGEKKASILLIGDSCDRQLVEAVCPQRPKYFSNETDEAPTFRALQCSLPGLDIAMYPIWGIFATGGLQQSAEGPYNLNMQCFRT